MSKRDYVCVKDGGRWDCRTEAGWRKLVLSAGAYAKAEGRERDLSNLAEAVLNGDTPRPLEYVEASSPEEAGRTAEAAYAAFLAAENGV